MASTASRDKTQSMASEIDGSSLDDKMRLAWVLWNSEAYLSGGDNRAIASQYNVDIRKMKTVKQRYL